MKTAARMISNLSIERSCDRSRKPRLTGKMWHMSLRKPSTLLVLQSCSHCFLGKWSSWWGCTPYSSVCLKKKSLYLVRVHCLDWICSLLCWFVYYQLFFSLITNCDWINVKECLQVGQQSTVTIVPCIKKKRKDYNISWVQIPKTNNIMATVFWKRHHVGSNLIS